MKINLKSEAVLIFLSLLLSFPHLDSSTKLYCLNLVLDLLLYDRYIAYKNIIVINILNYNCIFDFA